MKTNVWAWDGRASHQQAFSFHLGEAGDVYKWNRGCNWFKGFNRFSDLLSAGSRKMSSPFDVLHTNTGKKKKKKKFWNFETVSLHAWKTPMRDRDHIYPFIGYKARLSAHGPLGVRNRWLLVPVILHFSGPQPPHLLSLSGGQVSRQMANRQWGSIPWGSSSQEWPFFTLPVKWGLYATHTDAHAFTRTSAT